MTFVMNYDGNLWPVPLTKDTWISLLSAKLPGADPAFRGARATKFEKGWYTTMIKRIISLASCVLLAASIVGMSGCSKEEGETSTGGASTGGTESTASTPEKEVVDLDGYTFTWATLWEWWNYPEAGKSDYGDARTALYDEVQSKYNCKIEKVALAPDTFLDQINTAVMSGDKFADFIEVDYQRYQTLNRSKSLMALNTIEGFDVNQEKFFKSHTDAYTKDDNVYGVQYQYSQRAYGSFLFYNKTLLANEGLEDPYDLVKADNWNFTKFQEICKALTTSKSGGEIDQWGVAAVDWHANNFEKPMLFANGAAMIRENSEGRLSFGLLDTNAQNALNYLHELEYVDGAMVPSDKDMVGTFNAAQCGFFSGSPDHFEALNANFKEGYEWSIVPLPKGPDAEDYNLMSVSFNSWVMLKNNTADAKKAAIVFDAISEPLFGTVEEDEAAYFEGLLYNTFGGDERTVEMLKLCAEKAVADRSWGMTGGDQIGAAIYACVRDTEYTSQAAMESIAGVINGYIDGFFYGPDVDVNGNPIE